MLANVHVAAKSLPEYACAAISRRSHISSCMPTYLLVSSPVAIGSRYRRVVGAWVRGCPQLLESSLRKFACRSQNLARVSAKTPRLQQVTCASCQAELLPLAITLPFTCLDSAISFASLAICFYATPYCHTSSDIRTSLLRKAYRRRRKTDLDRDNGQLSPRGSSTDTPPHIRLPVVLLLPQRTP